jgi:CRP/FNR family transcriptional regulator, cyclic AMP receptor protein
MKITLQEELRLLKDVSLFSNLKPAEHKIIAMIMTHVIYEPGEVIVNIGDEGDEAYIVYSGEVEVYRTLTDGKIISLNILGVGEMFGELALFGDGLRTASVKALEETLTAVIAREKLYEIIREFPDIAIELLKVQTRRFDRAENRLMELLTMGA